MKKNNVKINYAMNMDKIYDYFKGKKGDEISVITHTDMDGIMAGSLVALCCGTKNVLMADYGKAGELGFDYHEVPIKDKHVIFTDYSFSNISNLMIILHEKPKSISVFDHHMNTLDLVRSKKIEVVKNKAAEMGVDLFYDVDINRCGTKIVFDAITRFSDCFKATARLVDLVDLYDRWKFKDNLDPVYLNDYLYGSSQAYVASPVVEAMITNKSEVELDKWLSIGKQYRELKEQMNKITASAFSFNTVFHGYNVLAIEARGNSQLLGNAINEYPFIIVFHYDNRKKTFTYSLFKRESSDVDILSIAKEYGGGGHVCACGFVSDKRLVTPQR